MQLPKRELLCLIIRLQPLSLILGVLTGILGSFVQGTQLALGTIFGLLMYAASLRRRELTRLQGFVVASCVCASAALVSVMITALACTYAMACAAYIVSDSAVLNALWFGFSALVASILIIAERPLNR